MTAYLALLAWSFLAATILPLASEPMLVALVRGGGDLALPVLVATAGNYLGACTTYWLARQAAAYAARAKSARAALPIAGSGDAAVVADPTQPSAQPPKRGHARAVALVERFGQPALLLSWVPIVGDAIVVVAGGVGIRFAPFSAWVIAGKLARYAAVAWVAARL